MAIPQVPSPLFLSLYLSDSTRTHIDYYSVMGVWLYTFLCFFFVFFLQRVKKKESKAGLILSSVISLAALATLLEVISSPTPATSLSSICSCCANPSAVNNRTLKSWPKEAFPQRQHVGLKKAFVNFFFWQNVVFVTPETPHFFMTSLSMIWRIVFCKTPYRLYVSSSPHQWAESYFNPVAEKSSLSVTDCLREGYGDLLEGNISTSCSQELTVNHQTRNYRITELW